MRIEITDAAPDYSTVLSVADLKAHLRVTHNVEDSLIASLRDAACSYLESYCNTKLHSTTAVAYMRGFHYAQFPVGPVSAITSIKYQTTSSAASEDLATLDPANYYTTTSTQPASVNFINYPTPYTYAEYPVQVAFSFGHSTAPALMIHAAKLLAAHLYENRQEVTDRSSYQIKLGLEALVSPYRNIVQP
jgi:uncharacterized phiE125 gp8 family phage protein